MQSMEIPLVLFTVLSQASVGIALMSAALLATGPQSGQGANIAKGWAAATALMVVGVLASLFHLGHPLESFRALAHLEKAWLSREVLAAGVFAVLAAAAIRANQSAALVYASAATGLVLLLASGMTYAPAALPAVNNALPTIFFVISAVVLGAGFISWFAASSAQPLLRRIFSTALVVGLVVSLAAPCIWLSGGEVMRQTGLAWLGSGLYWVHIAIMAACLAVAAKTGFIPRWLPLLALAGELAGRAAFFADTVHTATHMGGVY